jgi:hypothetical protein
MKKYLIIIGFILFLAYGKAYGTERNVITVNLREPELNRLKVNNRDWQELYGEIQSISATKVILRQLGSTETFQLTPQTELFCNNRACLWKALVPVAPYAYFETRIFVNSRKEVILINGFYSGEECVIKGWYDSTLGLELLLEPVCATTGSFKVLVNKNAALPKGSWLEKEQLIYVLYNYKQEIRAIFL